MAFLLPPDRSVHADWQHALKNEVEARGWTVSVAAEGGIVRIDAHDAAGADLPVASSATAEPFGHLKEDEPIVLVDGPLGLHATEPLTPGRYIVRATVGAGETALDWRAAVEVAQ